MSVSDVIASEDSQEKRMEEALGHSFTVPVEAESDDAAIVEAARTDPQAFGELYERFYPRVYRYVYLRVGNIPDAEDVTGLVFIKALEALRTYQSRGNGFAPWIFRIARNAVVDHYRRQRKQTSLENIDFEGGEGDPIISVLGNDNRTELRALVETLSADQREVILLRYAAELSFCEIATILKKKEPAIRMLLHRGLRKLKAVIDEA